MNSIPLFGQQIDTAIIVALLTFALGLIAYLWPRSQRPTKDSLSQPVLVRVERNGRPTPDVEILDFLGRSVWPNRKGIVSLSFQDLGKEFSVLSSDGVEILVFELKLTQSGFQRVILPEK